MTITPDELAEWRKVCEEATSGEWKKGYWYGKCHVEHGTRFHPGPPHCKYDYTLDTEVPAIAMGTPGSMLVAGDEYGWILSQEDSTFITTARTAMPRLLDELAAKDALIAKIIELVDDDRYDEVSALDKIKTLALQASEES